MDIERRSGCPINLTMEVLGDRWSLVVIRDIMFGNRRHFRELLTHSQEGIASNILAARLKRLVALGLVSKQDDPSHSQKSIYSLTEPAIQLVPVLAAIGAWGRRHLPVSEDLSIRAELLEVGGPALWDDFMADLRRIHIEDSIGGANGSVTSPVLARLTQAFLDARAKMKAGAEGR
ncbi:MAG: HxlR family transcriptional regulator [Proteobacteria bacterium]|nr:HxlR family transcriptional regulator [Pseudomonadota bacterium]